MFLPAISERRHQSLRLWQIINATFTHLISKQDPGNSNKQTANVVHWVPAFTSALFAVLCVLRLSSAYLADDRELRPVHMVAVDAEREDGSQRHHAAHRRHVVEVGLGVLDVAADQTKTGNTRFVYGQTSIKRQTAISWWIQRSEFNSFHLNVVILTSCARQYARVLISAKLLEQKDG